MNTNKIGIPNNVRLIQILGDNSTGKSTVAHQLLNQLAAENPRGSFVALIDDVSTRPDAVRCMLAVGARVIVTSYNESFFRRTNQGLDGIPALKINLSRRGDTFDCQVELA